MNVEQFKELFSPWFDVVIKGFQDSFLKDYDTNILAFLHENIDREIKFSLSSTRSTHSLKRTKALYNVLTHLYEHIQWKLRKGVSYACGKPGDPIKDFPNATLSCVKLLSQLIRTGLILTQGLSKCEYIDRILMALKLFTGKQALLFDALLLVNNLKKVYHKPFSVILRCVLITDYKEVKDPLFYMEIILLFRRLRALSGLKNKDFCYEVGKMKPPSNLIPWLSSLNINGSASFLLQLLQHKKIAHQLMKMNIPNTLIKRIRDLILESYHLERNNYKCRHSKTSESLPDLFITDTSPMQGQCDTEIDAADLSNKCSVEKDKTKKKKTKKRKNKRKLNKKEELMDKNTKNLTSLESNSSVSYVNSYSNLVVSNDPADSFHEKEDNNIYIIPKSKNKSFEPISVSTDEHRKSNKRKSKSIQALSPSQNKVSYNSSVHEIITISDSDSLLDMPPKKSKNNLNDVSPKRPYSEDDSGKIKKTKKFKYISSYEFSDGSSSNGAMQLLGSEICGPAKNVKKSSEPRRHSLVVDDSDEITLVGEITKSEATDVSHKLDSKEKHDANSVSFPQNTKKGLTLHDCSDYVLIKNKTSNQSFVNKNMPSVQLSSRSKVPSCSKSTVGSFVGDSTVTDVLVPQKGSISSASVRDNTHLPSNDGTEFDSQLNVLESVHNNGKEVGEGFISLSENSTDQIEATKVLDSNSEVPPKYCVTDKSFTFTEVKNQRYFFLDNNNQDRIKFDNSPENLDKSRTKLVSKEKSEVTQNYSTSSKFSEEIDLPHQNTNYNKRPLTFIKESNQSEFDVTNSSSVQNPNTEKQATAQSNVPHDKMKSCNEVSKVDSPVNLELQQSLNERTDKNNVSSLDLSVNNSDLDSVNREGSNQEQYPSCSESEFVPSIVSDSEEILNQKDLAQCVDVSELDVEKNLSEKDLKTKIADPKLDHLSNSSLSETKIFGNVCVEKENINSENVKIKNLENGSKTSSEKFIEASEHPPILESKIATNAVIIRAENYSESLQRKEDECTEKSVSQTSINVSSISYLPETSLVSPSVSDSKTQNYVTLPVKNVLGETLNVVMKDETSKTDIGESHEISPRTLCRANQNFNQISISECLNCSQNSALLDYSSHKNKDHECSSVLLNKSDCNESSEKHDKKSNELCILKIEALKETQNKSKTDAISLNDSQPCDNVDKSEENASVLTQLQNKEIISSSSHDSNKLLGTSSDQISGDISKENSGKAESMSENYTESTDTFATKITEKLIDMTELQSDMKAKRENNLPTDSNICDSSVDTAKEGKPKENSQSCDIVDKYEENATPTGPQNDEIINSSSHDCNLFLGTSSDHISEDAPKENNGKVEGMSKNSTESIDTFAAKFTEKFVDMTELQCNMKTENIFVVDAEIKKDSTDSSKENATLLNNPQEAENIEYVSQNDTESFDLSTNKITGNAFKENVTVLTESHDVESNLQANSKICDSSVDTAKESKLKENTAVLIEPQNDGSLENISTIKAQLFDISAEKAPKENVPVFTESESDRKIKSNLQINAQKCLEECDTGPKDIEKKNGPQNDDKANSNSQSDAPKIIENEPEGCVILTGCKNTIELVNDSQKDPEKGHISGDSVTQNVSPSILESTPSQNNMDAENVPKKCDTPDSASEENTLHNVFTQITLPSADDLKDKHYSPKLKSETSLEKIDVEIVSNDTQPKTTCNNLVNAESSLNVLKFKNSDEFIKESKFICSENSQQSFGKSPLKNALKFAHSEYVPHFCENKDYVSFSDISLRNKGKQIAADSCLKSPIAITRFPSAATAEIFCEYRNGFMHNTKAGIVPLEDVISEQPKSPTVSSICSDASKSPCVSSIASDEEMETLQYSSGEEDPLVNDRENVCSKESVQIEPDAADISVSLDTNENCNSSKKQSDSRNDSSPCKNIKSLEPSFESSSQANQNLPDVPDGESAEKICIRQSVRLKNKTNFQNETDFVNDAESEDSVPENPKKSAANVPQSFAIKECSVLCDNLPIKPSPNSTNSVLSSSQSSESSSSSQKTFSKKIQKSDLKLKPNKFISPKKPYSLRHRKSKQTIDNSSNLDLDLSKLQLNSPSCINTRSRTTKGAKFAELLASKIDVLKNDDSNDSTITKRETRSSTSKTEQDAIQNTPGYNLRNRKSIIAPSKLKI